VVILGIDPGSHRIGFGVVSYDFGVFGYIRHYAIDVVGDSMRHSAIRDFTKQAMTKYNPDMVGIEKVFFSRNVSTAIPVAQARGAILSAVEEHQPDNGKSIVTIELAPNTVKKQVTGNGKAEKKDIKRVLESLFRMKLTGPDDGIDALAIAMASVTSARLGTA
jgi:crossover junction endodeoxyribonuclease RuvC